MKIIVISGAHSRVGKTTLAHELCALIPGAVHVKLGHGARKENKGDLFYHTGTPFDRIAGELRDAAFCIIESNTILKEMTPDCTIYLSSDKPPKPSAILAEEKADIKRGSVISGETVRRLSRRLGLPEKIIHTIARLAGAITSECDIAATIAESRNGGSDEQLQKRNRQ